MMESTLSWHEVEFGAVRAAGRELAESIVETAPHGKRIAAPRKGRADRILARAFSAPERLRPWLLDNARLLRTADKQAIEFLSGIRRFPVAVFETRPLPNVRGSETGRGVAGEHRGAAVRERPPEPISRVVAIAGAYLDCVRQHFDERSCAAFIEGFQEVAALEMGEIWGLKPALQSEILRRFENAESGWPELVTSLRQIGETAWKDLFESVSLVDRALAEDPADAYTRMDFESRDRYRNAIASLAKFSARTELEIAEAAVALAQRTPAGDGRARMRRRHVGFYLVDSGIAVLKNRIGYRTPLRGRMAELALRYPAAFYLGGIEMLTFLTVVLLLTGAGPFTPTFAALLLVMLPATQTAVEFMNHLVTYLVPPRPLAKLDFSEGVPDDCTTLVAVPTLLLNEAQVRDLVLELEIRFLANRDPNIYFALVTDSPDSDKPSDERDAMVDVCRELIEGLNRRYAGAPFFLFHRHRVYNDSEGRYMGWERKRGKLLDLNKLMRGGFDAFPVKVGDLDVLPRVRYVITLDSDTQLPRDSAAKLIGAIAHPLNAAVVDPQTRVVVEGYGILQPRIGISICSAARSRLAALYSGETGFDIYTRAVSDVYQDLFGEGIFTGKGIYEVDVMREVLERRFPQNALLSHDLIEGAYARAALVSDIELIDDYPSHFSAYNRRKHRWVRGDWQIMRWIFSRVPDYFGQLVANPISLISQWKVMDNLRRSLFDPALLVFLLGAWLALPGAPGFWTALGVSLLFLPVYCDLFFALLRMPRNRRGFPAWLGDTARSFTTGHAISMFGLIFLLHQALLSMDAITRSVMRVFITKRRLLEWETAAEAEAQSRSKATVDVYLEWTPLIALLIGAAVWLVRPGALPAAAPVLALWVASRAFSPWLNRAPRTMNRALEHTDKEWLRSQGEMICRYFQDWSSPGTNWLIPDHVREDGEAALRLSPTNLGMLLNARIAALHFGVITLGEFIQQTRHTLDSVAALPKHRGHLLNWYDIRSMQPLEPLFVSTVDSGNLAAALWTVKQAALSFAAEPRARHGLTAELAAELDEIASISDTLVRQMDFRFLYNRRKKVLSVGYNVSAGRLEPSYYDLLASEARIAAFVAIAKGDIPQEAWFHLGRAHTLANGQRILLSWTGTMFEYLMPGLWMRHYAGTIIEQSNRAAVRVQREYCSRKGIPWGISESACAPREGEGEAGYAPFGVPGLALKRQDPDALVIAPYASFLAAMVDPAAALKNLRQMEEYGWTGRYGFHEAVDYSDGGGARVVRSWMVHHQGMALLALCNLLFNYPIQRYFHAEPQVLATELLLHERLPSSVVAEAEPAPAPPLPVAVPAAG
jgi:cyclic beta-1,2-glucan synthetase